MCGWGGRRERHTHKYTQKQKAKHLAATKVTRTWQSQDTCAPSRYCVPVLRNLPEPGKKLAGAPTVSLTAGVGTRSPTDAFSDSMKTQPVYFAPQYKTRYPDGWAEYLRFFFLCSGIRTGVLWLFCIVEDSTRLNSPVVFMQGEWTAQGALWYAHTHN